MKLLGDFQSVREGNKIVLSLNYVLGRGGLIPMRGSRVTIDDAEGHTAEAVVLAVRGRNIDAVVDWTSWQESDAWWSHTATVDFEYAPRFENVQHVSSSRALTGVGAAAR